MASPPILPYLTAEAYSRIVEPPREILCEAETIDGPGPLMFPHPPADFYDQEPLRYDFPPVTLSTLSDVVVRGRANTLTTREAILRHQLVAPQTDITPEEFYGRLWTFPEREGAAWAPTDPFNVDYLPEAAAFTDGTSFNYAHWMTEVLPRIGVFAKLKASARIPLIVDSELHPNMSRSLALVARPQAPVYRLAPDRLVRVGLLHSISPVGYVTFKLRPQATRRASHGVFAASALRETVHQLRRAAGVRATAAHGRRLLVRRSGDLRKIVNQPEIDAALEARGFAVIDPGALTLEQQIQAYSEAAIVVGGTGAAITNLIFSSQQCATIIMIPRLPFAAFWYWRRIAAAAGAGPVLHVVGELTEPLADPFDPQAAHKDFRVEVNNVLDAVDAAEALTA